MIWWLKAKIVRPCEGPGRGVCDTQKIQIEIECNEVRHRGKLKKNPWALGNMTRDRAEPRENCSDKQPRQPEDCEGGLETN